MPRWYLFLSTIVLPAVVFACNDDVVQEVEPEVCLSQMQWIGGKRGSPEMFPGRDCVGCHLENDGPELMAGGTVYPFVQIVADDAGLEKYKTQLQSGEDCFGQEGVNLRIIGADDQVFEVTTNRAGNFYVEGKATDLVKPFRVELDFTNPDTGLSQTTPMGTRPSYGGCARCHRPGAKLTPTPFDGTKDEVIAGAFSYIGVPGYKDLNKIFGPAAAQQ